MSTRFLLAVIIAVFTTSAGADDAHATRDASVGFTQANSAFAAGDYEAAAAGFRAIVETGRVSAALLYDLANSDSKAGRAGEAVLNYERALLLAPRDPDVQANLRQTRAAANLAEPQRGRWQQTAAVLTVDEWAWFAAAALWAACLLLAAHALRLDAQRRPTRLWMTSVAGLGLAAVACGSLATTRLDDLDRAVVVGPGPALRVAPFDSATISTELVAGQLVEPERWHESFVLVRTPDGQAGWIPSTDLSEILPR